MSPLWGFIIYLVNYKISGQIRRDKNWYLESEEYPGTRSGINFDQNEKWPKKLKSSLSELKNKKILGDC